MKPRHLLLLTAALVLVLFGAVRHGAPLGLLGALGAFALGTITVTQTTTGDLPSNDRQTWTIVSTSDSDANTGLVTHVMGVNPLITFEPIGAVSSLSLWYRTTLSVTQWAYQKSTLTGSGATTVQAQITLSRRR